MARDIDKEQETIRTGNRFVTELGGSTGVFPRDIDTLFIQYANLRNKIYSDYSHMYNDSATKEELRSYIDEEFIKLCKEYEINGEVDFPYYIKSKLIARVRGTFNSSVIRMRNREPLGATDGEVENMLDDSVSVYNTLDYQELVSSVVEGVDLTPLEQDVLETMVTGDWTVKQLVEDNTVKHNVSRKQVQEAIADIKELVAHKLGYHA